MNDKLGWHGERDVINQDKAYEEAVERAYEVFDECEPGEAREWYHLLDGPFDLEEEDAKKLYGSLMVNVEKRLEKNDPTSVRELLELANEVKSRYQEESEEVGESK